MMDEWEKKDLELRFKGLQKQIDQLHTAFFLAVVALAYAIALTA